MDTVQLRRAGADDAGAVADVFLASIHAAYEFEFAHTDEQTRRWIAEVVLATEEVWVATATDGSVIAMMALTADMLDQLYVAPRWTGHGIGGRLVALAKARRPGGLDLYTFQVNLAARRFYDQHGFVEVARGDGSGNQEGQPDVLLAWRPGVSGPSTSP